MGASRKLQGEIDRVLKKVQEGVDLFDSIWNKVYDTENANQKEKFEADLKKEIKKLQRYRDQIKTWIQSSEIKDKKISAAYEQALMDSRKLIEREMERFKICEKETKTKAFSKEGLGQQPKTDPKEKAKSETRDWLNNVVGELESQIDSFEAEMEGLFVKKGKTRPPRLIHLEISITRHKAHIMKLELILRLLDNDELSPEQVNDVKDFIDDYVERNQDDFDEFGDVDDLYSSLPLDKVESLEDLVTIGTPGLVKAAVTSSNLQAPSGQEQVEEMPSLDTVQNIPKTPPSKNNIVGLSAPGTPTAGHATPVTVIAVTHILPIVSTASTIISSQSSVRGGLEKAIASPSPRSISVSSKEEDVANFPGRKSSPALSETGLRTISRDGPTEQLSTNNLITSGGAISSIGALDTAVPLAERVESIAMTKPLVSPLSNRMILPQAAKANDGLNLADSGNVGEALTVTGRLFSPSAAPGIHWRPGSSFQNQSDMGQIRGRTEIAPDQREKFLQKFQQVQQQNKSTILGMPPLSGGNHKQFPLHQQNPLIQLNARSSVSSPQVGLGIGGQASGLNAVTSASLQQHSNLTYQQPIPQALMSTGQKDAEAGVKIEELHHLQKLSDEPAAESAVNPGVVRDLMSEDHLKASYGLDTPAGISGSLLTESAEIPRDNSSGQPLQFNQPLGGLGVIGRRNFSELGTIGDNVGGSPANTGGVHDQLYNLQMLESAFYKLPQPKDSERAKIFSPKHPAVTPPSYPQGQAPIVNTPGFWERLGADNFGTDTLFFAFYYQQNTYQQYLAAKELKRQSWRYHKKYNTWFQRHEEPKIATDDYEQGTYVYFDFHISDELQHGWCQRIKTEFKFEYNYLEDELTI